MPGAFNISTQRDAGATPRLSGAKSHIFQPPRTRSDSASSSLILTTSTSTNTSNRPGLAPRKRSRAESPRAMESSEYGNGYDGDSLRCPGSPMPFVNTKYVLAGGMDTPTLKAMGVESEYSDSTYRQSLGDENANGMRHTRRGLFCDIEGPSYFPTDGRQGNGRPVGAWSSPGGTVSGGWSRAAAQVVGGVAGKIWEFAKASGAVFRGFHAGGGQSYTLNSQKPGAYQFEQSENFWEEMQTEKMGQGDRESTPVPGQFPSEDFIPNYLDQAPSPSTERASKRRQVSRNNTPDEITKNWVVVPPASMPSKPQHQPRNTPTARYSMPTASSSARRPASRANFAAPRRPPLSRGISHVSHAGSPALTSARGASFASPRSSPNSKIPVRASSPSKVSTPVIDSPAAREAQKWAAVKKREEREADESIRRLDRQLKAMIREGKEALGTKVEVDFEFDGSSSGVRKWDI